jgi:hypothetical protein
MTATATTAYDNAITEIYGLPRMEDAEPEVPFNTATADTPRPTSATATATVTARPTFTTTFAQAAKHSATVMKHRRSLKTRTHYCLTASSRVQKAFQKRATENDMPPADFKLLKTALDRHRVRLDVSDRMTTAELKTLLLETRFEEQDAERTTLEAFRTNTADTADTADAADAAEIEIDAIKYCEAREKYADLKYWRETLVKEEMRVTPMMVMPNWGCGYKKVQDALPIPTQHAQIAASAANILRNILKPETIRRKFISLKVLTHQISEEVAHFLTDADRHADRICVVKQIRGGSAPQRRERCSIDK